MQELRREKDTLESQLKDVQKRALDHDDHLRVVDAWWTQVNFNVHVPMTKTDCVIVAGRGQITCGG